MDFEKVLEKALNSDTLTEVESYGYCHFSENYNNECKQTITVKIMELDGKTYLIKYVDAECVIFRDITALRK